jgi:hypothetical protein
MHTTNDTLDPALFDQLLQQIQQLIGPLHYGTVELTFHQGKLVQVEKKEKLRLADSKLRP